MSQSHLDSANTQSAVSAPGTGSAFLRTAIEEQLRKLRAVCAISKEGVRHAQDPKSYWGDGEEWRRTKAKCAEERPIEFAANLKALADFISEHRHIMGPDWIGNGHGRLCWAPYLGGMPIDHHFCQRGEGHDGNHADEWPETRWACNNPRGSWPQGVMHDKEWRALIEKRNTQAHGAAGGEKPTPTP